MFISGPINLICLYNSKNNHYVYLFGDKHEDKKNLCIKKNKNNIHICEFIINIIDKNPNNLISIYLESILNHDYNSSIITNDVISDINMGLEKTSNRKNFMLHHIEYRYMLLVENNISGEKQVYYDFLKDMENLDVFLAASNIDYIKVKDSIINVFEKYNIENIYDYIDYVKKSINNSKAFKQIDKINNNDNIKIINKYFDKYFNVLKKENKNVTLKSIINNKKNIKNFLVLNFLLQSIVFEMYSIGRILRCFKEETQYDNKKISIIYTGNNHVFVFSDILKLLNYKITGKSLNVKERCISITNSAFKDISI